MTELFVGHGVQITLHFELRLEDGEVVDSTFGGKPGRFTFGEGTLPSGIEGLIQGMKAGERQSLPVKPEHGFGMPNPQNIQRFKREDFATVENLQTGLVMSFADAAKAELPGVIREVTEDEVVVDFNHPLAGRTLELDVEIIKLEAVDTEVKDAN